MTARLKPKEANFPHWIWIHTEPGQLTLARAALLWCEQQFGPNARSGQWCGPNAGEIGRWYVASDGADYSFRFRFANLGDAVAFKLRWSELTYDE